MNKYSSYVIIAALLAFSFWINTIKAKYDAEKSRNDVIVACYQAGKLDCDGDPTILASDHK